MKKLTLSRLASDPLVKARAQTDEETVTVYGYVMSSDEDTISVCENQSGKSYVEYPRSSIIAGFQEKEDSTKVTFIVKSDANVRLVKQRKAREIADSKNCGCSKPGVKEARPLGSIHPALAAAALEMAKIKAAAGGSIDLKCGEARADCFRKGGTRADCDQDFFECHFFSTFA